MIDNPSVFPVSEIRDHEGNGLVEGCAGIALRDWFAGHALVGFTSNSCGDGEPIMGAADTAKAAYNYADAMLKAREQATMTPTEAADLAQSHREP